MSFTLARFCERFKGMFHGSYITRDPEFGLVYGGAVLLPVMWITLSSLDITLIMVASWFVYRLCQAGMAGIVFAKMNP